MENLPIFKDINKEKMFIIDQYKYGSNVIKVTMTPTSGFVAGITLVFASGTITIDWKDGSAKQNFVSGTRLTHTYLSAGTYIAEISGDLTKITQFGASNTRITFIENIITGTLEILDLSYNLYNGNLDLTKIKFVSTSTIYLNNNSNLTSIGFSNLGGTLSYFYANNCNLTGTLDLTNMPVVTNIFNVRYNSNLTGITFASSGNSCVLQMLMNNCNLDYVNTTNLFFNRSNALFRFNDNNMNAGDVNHILVDLDTMSSSGYTGRIINIAGTNAAPDSSSGGYDGTTAKTNLQGKGITVTTN